MFHKVIDPERGYDEERTSKRPVATVTADQIDYFMKASTIRGAGLLGSYRGLQRAYYSETPPSANGLYKFRM